MDDQYYLNLLNELNDEFGKTYSLGYESNNVESDRNYIKNLYNTASRVLIHRYARNLEYQLDYNNLINEDIHYDSIGSYMNDISKLEQPQAQNQVLIKIINDNALSQSASYNIIINHYESSEEFLEGIKSSYNLDIDKNTKYTNVDKDDVLYIIDFILNKGKINKSVINTVYNLFNENYENTYYDLYILTLCNYIASLMTLISFKIIYFIDINYNTNVRSNIENLSYYLSVFENNETSNNFIEELTKNLTLYINSEFNVELFIDEVKNQLFKTLTKDKYKILTATNYPNAQ